MLVAGPGAGVGAGVDPKPRVDVYRARFSGPRNIVFGGTRRKD